MKTTKRYQNISEKPINKDVITDPFDEIGFVTGGATLDPTPSIKIEGGIVVELDSKPREEFDSIDYFIADYGIDRNIAEDAMSISSEQYAKMLVDINVSRETICSYVVGLTPAKLAEIINYMNIVEIMMAQMKMRARKTIATQAHVTNLMDNPVLLAADAAEAALRGFAEIETTCVVGRYSAFNAMAILVGSQIGRPGVLTQCSMEEAVELELGMLGLTSYAETISVYGTEGVFTDGDDTPWSKAFLSSAYASRGIKMRSSSGSGSEVLMGDSEGKSMLYLETRCVWLTKASGIQGTQNGSIDGLALSSSLPGGLKMVAGESLIASMLGLEVASGNDTWFTDSDFRRSIKLATQLLPGTDFVSSGYSATPNEDNVFAGSNQDSDDFDDYYMVERDYLVDGGLIPVKEEDIIKVRDRACRAMQAIFNELGFSEIGEEEIQAAVYAYTSKDIIERNQANDIKASTKIIDKKISGVDIVAALSKHGFEEESKAILELLKQRVAGDYLQTSAIFDEKFHVSSSINDKNEYSGPGSGYQIPEERTNKLIENDHIVHLDDIVADATNIEPDLDMKITERGDAQSGHNDNEVIIIVSPSFGESQKRTMGKVAHVDVLDELSLGLEEEGAVPRYVKCYESTDLGVMASIASKMSGSGISIAVQSKGTAVIHQRDLSPLANLELFSQGPQLSEKLFREIGKSAGKYTKSKLPDPIPAVIDPEVRRFLVSSAILHYTDTQCVQRGKAPVEFTYERSSI